MMETTSVSQRVRVTLARLQATSHGRPVALERLLRELPEDDAAEVDAALHELALLRLAHEKEGGWLTRPPPIGLDATLARSQAARLHGR